MKQYVANDSVSQMPLMEPVGLRLYGFMPPFSYGRMLSMRGGISSWDWCSAWRLSQRWRSRRIRRNSSRWHSLPGAGGRWPHPRSTSSPTKASSPSPASPWTTFPPSVSNSPRRWAARTGTEPTSLGAGSISPPTLSPSSRPRSSPMRWATAWEHDNPAPAKPKEIITEIIRGKEVANKLLQTGVELAKQNPWCKVEPKPEQCP